MRTPDSLRVRPVYVLFDTRRTFALLPLAIVIPPAPEMTSKNDLLELRRNFSVAPASITTEEGTASVPGNSPLDPPWPSCSVPVWMNVPPAQVALGLSRRSTPMPYLESEPGPEMVPPPKCCCQAPVSSDPPPVPRMRFRWNV